jgi:signal transduction histidine kinase
VLITVLLGTNAAVILHLRKSEAIHEENQLKNLSLILAEQADRSFRSVDLVISSVADEMTAEGVTDAASFDRIMAGHDIYLLLREKKVGVAQLDAVTVIGRDGKVVNFSRFWPAPDLDDADRHYFQVMKADPDLKRYVTEPVQNRGTGAWTVFLAHRVNGANGEFLGLIIGGIELRYFEDFYRAISFGEEGSSFALERLDGTMLARFPPIDATGKIYSDAQRFLPDGVSGILREVSAVDGQARILAAHRLPDYPVFAVATKTKAAVLANWWGIARLMSLGALVCAIAIGVAGFAFGRQSKHQAVLADAQAELGRQEDRTEAAEMANRVKSEFLANMSHELRTPLNAVLGFSEIMVHEGFSPLGDDRYREYAQDIHASGTHLLSIVNDILDLSKAASGKLGLAEDWFDARDVITSVCRLIQPSIGNGALSLTVKLPPDELVIYADERLLRQMMLNLLANACKFTPPNGHIECSVSADAAGIAFAVTDTGIGIPAEDLERVLEPFIQVDSSLNRRHEGTGLGLALVKIMAELHGGSLRLDSDVGSGTIATVIFPLSRLKPASTDAPQPTEQVTG